MTSRFLHPYEERVLEAIENAMLQPQTPGLYPSDPLDHNPTRSTDPAVKGVLIEDPETGLLYLVEVQLV